MTEIIKSLDNKVVKEIVKLRTKKNRVKFEKYIIESKKLIMEAINSGVEIEMFILREGEESIDFNFRSKRIFSEKLFSHISTMESPDGYMAIVKMNLGRKISSNFILVLDRIQNPGNLGTLIRSAEAFGFNDILCIESVDPYNEKSLRASMGSIFRLNYLNVNYDDILNLKKDYNLVCADMSGEDYNKVNFENKIALIIGNEANGISDIILNMVDKTVKINMKGSIESLNAAISGSILMNHIGNK